MEIALQPPAPIDIQFETQITENFCYKVCQYTNKRLFAGTLPPAQIFLKSLRSSVCTFEGHVIDHVSGQRIDRINVNSRVLKRTPVAKLIISLIDAMISQKQFHYGAPGRGSYRNKERAALSKEIGLIPSDTAAMGGKDTGENVLFYYDVGSAVDDLIRELLSFEFVITWEERPKLEEEKKSGGKRYKYACPHDDCIQNFYAGQKADFNCGIHDLKALLEE